MRYKNWQKVIGGRLGLIIIGSLTVLTLIVILTDLLDPTCLLSGTPLPHAHWIDWIIDMITAITIGLISITLIRQSDAKRREAEQALRKSEEGFRLLFENAKDAIFWANPETGWIINCNKSAEALLERRREEIIGYSQTTLHPPEKSEYYTNLFKKHLEQKGAVDDEAEIITKSGKIKPVHITASVTNVGGKQIIQGIFRDITERKKMEEELKASESKYKTLLENIPQRIFLKDENLVYLSCNENYARDLKLKPHMIVGKTDYDFYPKELAEKYRADDKRIMQTGKTEDLEEDYIQDGQKVFVHTVKTPVKDEKGNIIGVLGIFWDITERTKLQQQLIQTEKLAAVGTLAYGIAHEFNNILAGMMGNAELGLITQDPQQRKECFQTIVENSLRASSITNNLLAFARQKEVIKELVDLTQPLNSVLSITRRELEKLNIQIVEKFKPIPKIFCDAGQFSEVFLNLLTNARDAMIPQGGDFDH